MDTSIHSKPYDELRTWLIKKRAEQQGLTVRALADDLNIDFTIITKIENGVRRLDIVEFVKYCEALGADPLEGVAIIQKNILSGSPFRPPIKP